MREHYLFIISFLLLLNCKGPTSSEFIRNNPKDPELATFKLSPPQTPDFRFLSDKSVLLSWQDSTNYTDGYILEKSLDGANFFLLDTVDYPTLEYLDESKEITSDTRYSLKSFRRIDSGLNVSDSIAFEIDFGEMIITESFYSSTPSGLTLTWDFTSEWPFIVVVRQYSENENIESLDTLFIPDTSFTYLFERDFSYHSLEARAFINQEELEKGKIFNSGVSFYEPLDVLPEIKNVNIIDETEVLITWEDNSDFEEGFEILRSKNYQGKDPEVIAIVPANTTTFIDTLSPFENAFSFNDFSDVQEKSVFYGIRAFKGESGSGIFGEKATLRISKPSILVNNSTENAISLSWSIDNSSEAIMNRFILQRKVNGSFFSDYRTFDKNTFTYTDTDIIANNTYSYRIKTLSSNPSDELNFIFSEYPIPERTISVSGAGFFRFSDSGNLIVTSGYNFDINSNRRIFIYDINSGQKIYEYEVMSSTGYEISNVDIDELNSVVAFASDETNSLIIIDYLNDQIIDEINDIDVYDLEFTPNGKYIYTISWFSHIHKHNINDGITEQLMLRSSRTGSFRSISVNPQGDKIAANQGGKFLMVDSSGTGIPFQAISLGSVSNHINFSGSGKLLSYISHFKSGYIYEVESKERVFGLSTDLIGVSSDDKYVLAWSRNILYLIDLESKSVVYSTGYVTNQLRFSPTSPNTFIIKSGDEFHVFSISDSKKWNKVDKPNIYDNQ